MGPGQNEKFDEIQRLVRAGELDRARHMLKAYLEANKYDAEAWFLAAQLSTRKEIKIQHLQRVLLINPEHLRARDQLRRLGGEEINLINDAYQLIDNALTILANDGVGGLWRSLPLWGKVVVVVIGLLILWQIVSVVVGLLG